MPMRTKESLALAKARGVRLGNGAGDSAATIGYIFWPI